MKKSFIGYIILRVFPFKDVRLGSQACKIGSLHHYRIIKKAVVEKKITYKGYANAMREYIHVYDAASAAVNALKDEFSNNAFIITGQEAIKVTDMLKILAEIMNIDENDNVEFSLLKTYPNPFNPSLNIEYHMEKSSNVKISIYDINGRLVDSILDVFQSAGNHKINWNSKDISTGVYIVKLSLGSNTYTQRVVLLK